MATVPGGCDGQGDAPCRPVACGTMLRSLGGGALFGEQWGPEPPAVVALHGWRRTHRDFAGVLGPAGPGGPLAALALDLPGFGASPPPPEAWGSARYAEAVAKVVDADAGGGPVVVVGHSFGGRVGLLLAATRPDLVRGLVLTGAPVAPHPGPPVRPPRPFRLARRLHRLGLLGDAAMERARQRHGSEDYRLAEGVMRQVLVTVLAERYGDALDALACPLELVWADDDTAAPLAGAEAVAAAVPGARLTVCPGAGHLVPLTAPAELRAAVERLAGA